MTINTSEVTALWCLTDMCIYVFVLIFFIPIHCGTVLSKLH